MGQIIQVAGALAILAAFALAQAGVLRTSSYPYLVLNAVGATVLAVEAWLETQWGFLLLEAAWAVVAAWSLAGLVLSAGRAEDSGRCARSRTRRRAC
jgi:hypothetical protein